MTDTIAHPEPPKPAGHTFPSILEALAKVVCHGHIYSLPQRDPVYGSTVPLYTAQQMREYRDAPAWLPIETAPKTGLVDIMSDGRRYAGCHWDAICGEFRHITACCVLIRLRKASHWAPIPAAPIEQATGEQK